MNLSDNFFSEVFKNEKTIENIRKECINIDIDDVLKVKFLDKVDVILIKYPLVLNERNTLLKQITFNFWNIISCYNFQKTDKNPKSNGTLIDYLNVSTRILEFAIYIEHKEIQDIKKIYFDIKAINVSFFKHFIAIQDEILSNNRDLLEILKDKTNKYKLTVFVIDEHKYMPSSIPKNEIESGQAFEKTFWFERYFRLNNKQILDIFEKIGSKGNMGGKRSSRASSKYKYFDEYKHIDQNILTDDNLSDLIKIEDKLEAINIASKIPSIMFPISKEDKEDKNLNSSCKEKNKIYYLDKNILGIKLLDKHLNSNYKEYLVNKKISYYYAQNNMYLYSKSPNINTFRNLVAAILKKKNDYKYSLILISLFTGISMKDVVRIFFNQSNNFSLKKNLNIMEVTHDKNIFANKVPKNDIFISRSGNKSILYLPDFLNDLIIVVRAEYEKVKINKENIEDFSEKEYSKCNEVLNQEVKLLSKTISHINLRKIHKLFHHYFNIFHEKTDTSILFLVNLNKSNQVRVTYTSQPKRLVYYELWIEEFYNILIGSQSNVKSLIDANLNQEVGSPKVLKSAVFKNFLLNLSYLNPKNKIEEFNLKMIFIRYSLSISLATRDAYESCDLKEISRYFKILSIHEKAKHIKTSKRLIPLTDKALFYIDEFFELIRESTIDSTYPILLKEENDKKTVIPITLKTILDFIQTFKNDIKFDEIEKFVKLVDMNFGRHVFSTEALIQGFNKDYENEFMGHFSNGSSGLGMYSNFDLNDYIESSNKFVESIENKYFPKYITHKDIKCYLN